MAERKRQQGRMGRPKSGLWDGFEVIAENDEHKVTAVRCRACNQEIRIAGKIERGRLHLLEKCPNFNSLSDELKLYVQQPAMAFMSPGNLTPATAFLQEQEGEAGEGDNSPSMPKKKSSSKKKRIVNSNENDGAGFAMSALGLSSLGIGNSAQYGSAGGGEDNFLLSNIGISSQLAMPPAPKFNANPTRADLESQAAFQMFYNLYKSQLLKFEQDKANGLPNPKTFVINVLNSQVNAFHATMIVQLATKDRTPDFGLKVSLLIKNALYSTVIDAIKFDAHFLNAGFELEPDMVLRNEANGLKMANAFVHTKKALEERRKMFDYQYLIGLINEREVEEAAKIKKESQVSEEQDDMSTVDAIPSTSTVQPSFRIPEAPAIEISKKDFIQFGYVNETKTKVEVKIPYKVLANLCVFGSIELDYICGDINPEVAHLLQELTNTRENEVDARDFKSSSAIIEEYRINSDGMQSHDDALKLKNMKRYHADIDDVLPSDLSRDLTKDQFLDYVLKLFNFDGEFDGPNGGYISKKHGRGTQRNTLYARKRKSANKSSAMSEAIGTPERLILHEDPTRILGLEEVVPHTETTDEPSEADEQN